MEFQRKEKYAQEKDQGVVVVTDADRREMKEEDVSELVIPPQLKVALRPHQIAALHFIWRRLIDDGLRQVIRKSTMGPLTERVRLYQEIFGCTVGHSMGLGKTITALSFLLLLQQYCRGAYNSATARDATAPAIRALVLTPRSCTYHWHSNAEEWMRPELFGGTFLPVYAPLGSRKAEGIILDFYQNGGILLLGYEEHQKLMRRAAERMTEVPQYRRVNSIFDNARPPLPLSSRVHILEMLESPDVVILDESHRLKRVNSKLVRGLMEHLRGVQLRLALTGTPLQNHLEEYNVMHSVVTGSTVDPASFRRLFITPIERGQCSDSTYQQFIEMQKCVASLRRFFGTTVHHCGPEVLERELPPRREYMILVGLSAVQEEVYRAMLKRYTRSENTRIILSLHHEASHVCCHPMLSRQRARRLTLPSGQTEEVWPRIIDCEDGDSLVERGRSSHSSSFSSYSSSLSTSKSFSRSYPSYSSVSCSSRSSSFSSSPSVLSTSASSYSSSARSCSSSFSSSSVVSPRPRLEHINSSTALERLDLASSPKLALTLSLLEHIDRDLKEKAVLFSIYRSHLFLLVKLLRQRGIVADVLHGGVEVNERQRFIERFSNDASRSVLLCSTKASGVGINLTAANHCILFDVSWNPADDTQATYRLYRYGQKRPVTIYRIATDGTFEHVVFFYALQKSWLHKKIIDVADPARYERHMKDSYFVYPCGISTDFESCNTKSKAHTLIPNSHQVQQRWREYAVQHCPAVALTATEGTFAWIRSITEHNFLLRDSTAEDIREMGKRFEMEKRVSRLPIIMERATTEEHLEPGEPDSILERCEPALQDCLYACAEYLAGKVQKKKKKIAKKMKKKSLKQQKKQQNKDEEETSSVEEGNRDADLPSVLCELLATIAGVPKPVGGLSEIMVHFFHRGVNQVMQDTLRKPQYAKQRAVLGSKADTDDSLMNSLRYKPCELFSRMNSSETTYVLTELGFTRSFVPHCTIFGMRLALRENGVSVDTLQSLHHLFTHKGDIVVSENAVLRYMERHWPLYTGMVLPGAPTDLSEKQCLTERAYQAAREHMSGFFLVKEVVKIVGVCSVRSQCELYHCSRCKDGLLDLLPPDFMLKCRRCHFNAEFEVQTHADTRHACALYQLSFLCGMLESASVSRSFTPSFLPETCHSVLDVLQNLHHSCTLSVSTNFIFDAVHIGIDVLLKGLPETTLNLLRLQCGAPDLETLKTILAVDSTRVWLTIVRSHVRQAVTNWFKATIATNFGMQFTTMPEMLVALALHSVISNSGGGTVYAREILHGDTQLQQISFLRFMCDGLVMLNYVERLLAHPLTQTLMDALVAEDHALPHDSIDSRGSSSATGSDSGAGCTDDGDVGSRSSTNSKKRRRENNRGSCRREEDKRRRIGANSRSRSCSQSSGVSCASATGSETFVDHRTDFDRRWSHSSPPPLSPLSSSSAASSSFNSVYPDDGEEKGETDALNKSVASSMRNSTNRTHQGLVESEVEVLRLRSVHYSAAYCSVYGTRSLEVVEPVGKEEEEGGGRSFLPLPLPPPWSKNYLSNDSNGVSAEGMQLSKVALEFFEKLTALCATVRVISAEEKEDNMSEYGDSFNSTDSSTTSITSISQPSSPKEKRTDSALQRPLNAPVPIPVPVEGAETRYNTHTLPSLSVGLVSADPAGSPSVESANEVRHSSGSERVNDVEEVRAQLVSGVTQTEELMSSNYKALSSFVAFKETSKESLHDGVSVEETPEVNMEYFHNSGIISGEEEEKRQLQASAAPVTLDPDRTSSHAGSSVFSTLSQHLTRAQMSRNRSTHIEPFISETEVMAKATATENVEAAPPSRDCVTTEETLMGSATPEMKREVEVEALMARSTPLPDASGIFPTTQISFKVPAPGSLLRREQRLPPVGDGAILGGVPAPLPPREPRQDPKIIELRETSEAVERLVRAFALLRGHGSIPKACKSSGNVDASFATKDTTQLSSLRQRRTVGDVATLQVHQSSTSRVNFRKQGSRNGKECDMDSVDKDREAAVAMNEAIVEDAIMCLVMELLQRDAKHPFEDFGASRKAIQPSFDVVAMDDFRTTNTPCSGRKQQKTNRFVHPRTIAPLSVFDDGMRAFFPDDVEASESLYHSIIQALQKYVLSHVDASLRHVGPNFPPASPHIVWVLQLDLLSVCMQVLETRLIGKRGTENNGAPVWIQYEGSSEAESLARNAVHCLPFEALDAQPRKKPIFRMEYWVTADKMWTVVEALAASIRQSIVARSDGYRVFSRDEDIQIGPVALFPTRVPFFSLLSSDVSGAHPDGASKVQQMSVRFNRKTDGANDEPGVNYFEVEPATLESMAHMVSTVSTEMLESDVSLVAGRNYKQGYEDATRAVMGAVSELLTDTGIRTAVQRRAKAKMMELAQRREADGRLSREERERSIIAAAEVEAERVVQRILQEMRLEEARGG